MYRAIWLTLLSAVCAFADTGYTNTIRVTETDNSPSCSAGQIQFQPGQVTCSGQKAVINITGGGGGGSSSLEVLAGVRVTSPTASISFNSNQFTGLASGSTAQISLNQSSVTVQGNTFNAASKLVRLDTNSLPPSGWSNYWNSPSTATFDASQGITVSTITISSTAVISGGNELLLDYNNFPVGTRSRIRWKSFGSYNGSIGFNDSTPNGMSFYDGNDSEVAKIITSDIAGISKRGIVLRSTGAVRLYDGDNTNYVSIRGSNTVTANVEFVLPATDGSAGQAMLTDGTQNLYFDSVSLLASSQTVSATKIFTSSVAFNSGVYIGTGTIINSTVTLNANNSVVFSSAVRNGFITITLPPATNTGQQISITKVDRSTDTIRIRTQGTDLIGGATGQFILYAPGQQFNVIADGISTWSPYGEIPIQPAFLGFDGDPNSAAAVATSSNAYCNAVSVPTFVASTGMRWVVGTANGSMDVGIYDSLGNRVVSTGTITVPGTGNAGTTWNPVYLSPGVYWMCISASNTSATFGRYGTNGVGGGCQFTTSHPLPASFQFNGCTISARRFALYGVLNGGPSQ